LERIVPAARNFVFVSAYSWPSILRFVLQENDMAAARIHSDIRDFLFRSNPIPMFLYAGGSLRIRGANDAALATYGYTCKEIRSMTIRELRPLGGGIALDTVPLSDLEIPSRSLETHTTKSGSRFAVDVQVAPFPHGRHTLFLLSAAKASDGSDSKLVRSEQIYRSLVEQSPFGIYRLNLTTSRFEQANPVLLLALGYNLEELCAIEIPNLYCEPGERDRFLSELRSTGSAHDFETCFRKKDGGVLRASLSGYLGTHAETGEQYIQGYVQDTTRQRELEEQLSHSQQMEAVGRLAGGVAHEFNNITQSISLSCELALSRQRATAIESKLLDIMQQAARAAEITQQLLDFSCSQVLQPRVVNVNDCIRGALSKLARVAGGNVSIRLELDDTVDSIIVDPDQLARVLMHLTSNARAAMPQGGLLRISTSRYSPDPTKNFRSERCSVLTVSHTGIGMDKKTLNRIFEPFFPTPNTSLTAGLGLSTVHGIIAQSKGYIECESSHGQGATFRIYLPVAASQPDTRETIPCERRRCG
jgi:PAS domain S-box-containing protein